MLPYNSEYLPTSNYLFFYINLTIISVSFIDFFSVVCIQSNSKIILVSSLILKAAFLIIFLFTFVDNLLIYSKGELIDNFVCNNTVFQNSSFTDLDKFLIKLDQTLCNDECICYIRNIQDYLSKTNPVLVNQWSYNDKQGPVNIQGCLIKDVDREMRSANISQQEMFFYRNNKDNEIFNFNEFISFWRGIENDLQCSGFCVTSYLNSYGVRTNFSKYLFSDVNLGVPKTRGCYTLIKDWVNDYYKFSSITFVFLILSQGLNLALFAGFIFWSKERTYKKASQINYNYGYEMGNEVQMNDLIIP